MWKWIKSNIIDPVFCGKQLRDAQNMVDILRRRRDTLDEEEAIQTLANNLILSPTTPYNPTHHPNLTHIARHILTGRYGNVGPDNSGCYGYWMLDFGIYDRRCISQRFQEEVTIAEFEGRYPRFTVPFDGVGEPVEVTFTYHHFEEKPVDHLNIPEEMFEIK